MQYRMRVVLLLVAVAVVLTVGCDDNSAGGSPGITVLQGSAVQTSGGPAFDLGDVYGTPILSTFTIRNDGDGSLSVTVPLTVSMSVSPSTNDTEITILDQPLEAVDPGSTTDFVVRLSYETSPGAPEATVTIVSNDADESNFELNLTGYVYY